LKELQEEIYKTETGLNSTNQEVISYKKSLDVSIYTYNALMRELKICPLCGNEVKENYEIVVKL
jgi:hypothetical protein